MLKIKGSKIMLTRGDTAQILITLKDSNGDNYVPQEGDVIRFAAKKNYSDETPVIEINVPVDTLYLVINPEDTKSLPFGEYKYDIQITRADGVIDTFIDRAEFWITEEVE